MAFSSEAFKTVLAEYPKEYPDVFAYGTSGIRSLGCQLKSTAFRLGIIAAIRSQTKKGQAIGVMITASHNPADDNGIKLIDSHGSMLDEKWEPICTKVVNASDDELEESIRNVITAYGCTGPCTVFLGADTRETSPALAKAAAAGAKILDAEVRHYGKITTPQLHYMVYCYNKKVGNPTEDGYYHKISLSFKELCSSFKQVPSNYVPLLNLDCANGVGGVAMKKLAPLLEPFLKVILHKCSEEVVNFKCGSAYVESKLEPPTGCELIPNEHWASLDGDADRIVFYYLDSQSNFRLLNGDKIAALFCIYIKDLLTRCDLADKLSFQVIQTAYTNASATNFLKNTLGLDVGLTATGVKHLMKKTGECDISVWFESNGHGSIRFSDKSMKMIKHANQTDSTGAPRILIKIFELMSQSTGDAISDFLLVEAILRAKDWDLKEWDSLYTNFPSRLTELTVPDRNFIRTNDLATVILEPIALQREITALIKASGPGSRAVVRPSGTEDLVRVYTESSTQVKADILAEKIMELVTKYA